MRYAVLLILLAVGPGLSAFPVVREAADMVAWHANHPGGSQFPPPHLLESPPPVIAPGTVSATVKDGRARLVREGPERFEVEFHAERGLINAPVTFRVYEPEPQGHGGHRENPPPSSGSSASLGQNPSAGRELQFGGFRLRMNECDPHGWSKEKVSVRTEGPRLIVEERLAHPDLKAPTQVAAEVWLEEQSQTARFRLTPTGEGQHLDELGLHPHTGEGLEVRRLFFGNNLAVDGPIQPFSCGAPLGSTRFWAFSLANGLTEVQGLDLMPTGFACDPGAGVFDLRAYCAVPVTYTFVLTAASEQAALGHFRRSQDLPAPSTLAQVPGRTMAMTWHPIAGNLEGFLEEVTGKGLRDFCWLSYSPTPGDRARVEPFGGLYAVYENYVDYYDDTADEGKRKCLQWSPETCLYYPPGTLVRGYHGATRLLPNLYVEYATKREMGLYGREDPSGYLRSAASDLGNLKDLRDETQANAVYFDVHGCLFPSHYWDHAGTHYSTRDAIHYTRELFQFAREYLGGAPVFTEGGSEWLVGAMDGGAFNAYPTPETFGLQGAAWAYYPLLEQIHRERLLSIALHYPYTAPPGAWREAQNGFRDHLALTVLTGRPDMIGAYWGSDLSDNTERLFQHYLTSSLSRALGTSPITHVDFDGGNLRRPIVHYANGCQVLVNRSEQPWPVDYLTLPPSGYLAVGPDFLQFRASLLHQEGVLDYVNGPDYLFVACPTRQDFGFVETNGALAVRRLGPGRLAVYEIAKPNPSQWIVLRLEEVLGPGPHRLKNLTVHFLGGRTAVREFPDVRQESQAVKWWPAVDGTALRYELEVE